MDEREDLGERVDPQYDEVKKFGAGPSDPLDERIETEAITPQRSSTPKAPDSQNSDEIRDDIDDTRVEMSETIDAIQERLNPQTLMDQAKESVRDATVGKAERMVSDASDAAKDTGNSMIETIKQNPIPAAMAAFGVGWLWTHRQSASSSSTDRGRSSMRGYRQDYGDYRGRNDPYGPYGSTGQSRYLGQESQSSGGGIGETAGKVQDKAGQVASQVQDQADQWTGQAQDQLQQVKSQFDYLLNENPLAVAAVALGLGAAAGLIVPGTQKENRWMGEARDEVLDTAQSAAQDTMQKVQQVASKAQDAAQQEAKQQGLSG